MKTKKELMDEIDRLDAINPNKALLNFFNDRKQLFKDLRDLPVKDRLELFDKIRKLKL